MKLICINNHVDRHSDRHKTQLILGESYDGEIYDKDIYNFYWIIFKLNSRGINEGWAYPKDVFISLAEFREQQILSVIL